MGWLNFGGKKGKQAKGFGNSQQGKRRPRRKTFILEKIVTPSAGVGGWLQDFDPLHQLLGSLSLSDLHLPNFLADSGVCPIDPSAPTDNLPPLIDFDPLGLYHDGIATQTPYNIGGAFETLPVAVIPIDPHSPNANDPNAIRQLLDFPLASQPLVGTIDTGVSANSPYLNYANIKKGRDYVDGDDNPLLKPGEGSEHGTFMLGIIDAINKTAPKWVGRAIDSGRWADSLVEFVDAAKASGQKNAIANLSLDLTQKNADGSVTTRYELTPQERSAIEYARQNGVMLVAAAGNDGGVMSVLGQASQEFDNIITVGAGDINGRSIYSSFGRGLDIVADGGTSEHPALSTAGDDLATMAGTSVATAKVTGAISLVWAANPGLSYRQVIDILEKTARDLGAPGRDDETGFGFLNTLAAVDLAKKTAPEVYNPTPWVTPGTWSGEGKVTPEERAAKGGNSIAEATVQVSTNFSDIDRVDANQPQKYYQFTVNEPGYVSWNLTSLNPVSGFPTPPEVTVTKADGKPGSHTFFRVIGAFLESYGVGEGQTSFQGGNFYDPGTYYLKVGNGAGSTFNDYNISTQFIADRVSSFTGNIQYRTQPYYSLDNSRQSAVFSGPAVSELSNLSGVVTYDNINLNNRIAKYGVEVNESGKIRINLNSPNGKMGVSVKKFIGSDDRPESIASLEVSANSDRWLELDLNKGRYDIEVNTPSDVWLEPDWNSTQEKLVRPYTLNATFTPNAPQPGQGQVPSSAGAFDKTVVSNGVVNHYYKNGYLTVQPSGQASWYGYRLGVVSISGSAQPLNDPVPLPDPDGNYSIQTAANVLLPSGDADLGDGVNSNQVGIGYILSSIGGKDLNDFYKFSFDSLKLVNFYLSQSGTAAQWWLIQDRNGNGQVDPGEAIKTGTITTKPLDLDVILGAGDYYLQVGSLSSDATSVYAVNVAARSLENQVIASYNSDYYLVQNGQLRLIPNQETLTAMGIAANTVKTFSNQDLTLIPYGDDLPSRKNGDVFGDLSGRIYLMESGKRRLVPDWDTLRAIGINVTYFPMFPESDIKDIELGDPYAPPIPQWQKDIDNTYQYTRNLLGNPTGSYWQAGSSPNGTQGYGQNYDNGTIYWTAQSGAIALWYAFKDTYNQNGGSNGWLGFPTKGKEDWEGGQRIDFEGGYIYWTAQSGAKAYRPNESPSLDKTVGYDGTNTHQTYINTFYRNGGASALGSATGNVHPAGTGNDYLQEFSGGSEGSGVIMKSGANDNSYWVGGAFWAAYQDAVSQGKNLGYPTSDRYEVNGVWRQDFQSGARISTQPSNNNSNNNSPIDGMTPYEFGHLGNLDDTLSEVAARELGNSNRWVEIRKLDGSTYTDAEARQIQRGTIVYLPKSSGNNNNTDGGTGNTGGSNNNNTLPVQPADFTKALAFNLLWEGGYSNHPSDPGGATNKGITQNTYNGYRSSKGLSTQDVRWITDGEVRDIYYTNYWIASGSDQLTSRLAMVHFDTAVNMGTTASRLLQQARQSANGDEMSVVRRYLDLREAEYRAIVARNPSMGVFLQGWLNRLNSLRAEVGATGGSSNNNNGGNNNTGGSLGQLGYVGIGVTPIDDSQDNKPSTSSLEVGLNSLSWTKQRLEDLDRLIEYGNQFELPLSSDPDDLLFRKFANRPGTGKEFNYAEYLQLKAVNSLLKGAVDYTTQTDDLIEDYIDSIADSEDFDTAQKLYSLKQSWESKRKQAQEIINQKHKSLGNLGSIFLESFAEFGRILQNSGKGAVYGISAYLRIRALINGGPLAKLSSYYSTEDYWQREESERISGDLGKLVDVLGWILSNKLGDLQKSENFSDLGIVVSAIAGDIMGWMEKYRLNGGAGLIGDFKSISDEIKKIVDIDKILAGQSGIYVDEDDREFLNGLKVFSIGRLMSTAFSMVLNASKLGFGKAAGKNDILATIESSIKIFNDVSVIIEQGYEAMSRGHVRNSYDRHVWLNELYNSTIRIDREYIIGVAEVLGDYVAK